MKEDRGLEYFCSNIKHLREREGLSKTKMAKILQISPKTLMAIESGILPPRLDCRVLLRIQRQFGIKPAELFRSVIRN